METVIKPILELLHELYIGTSEGQSWVIDAQPGHGFTAAIKTVTAQQASTPIIKGGTTIAAHTEHIRWSLYYALEFYKGNQPKFDWKESWTVREVNDQQWKALQQELIEAYNKAKAAIEAVTDWSTPYLLQGTIALLPHAAYHLGAVKQQLLYVNSL